LGPAKGFSRAVEAASGRTIYLSGQVSTDRSGEVVGVGDMTLQARTCLDKLALLLDVAGGSMKDIVELTMYVTDMSRMAEVQAVRAGYFDGPVPPAMTGVQVVALAKPEFLIEMAATAVIEEGRGGGRGEVGGDGEQGRVGEQGGDGEQGMLGEQGGDGEEKRRPS
jgi:enamine deaminase RidA (YjgF/YER057c/UK114 family)